MASSLRRLRPASAAGYVRPNTPKPATRATSRRLPAALALATAVALCGCSPTHRPDWVIRFSLQLVGPPPAGGYRLIFPYIVGDLYGSPSTGDFVVPEIFANHSLALDLNRTREDLERELGPTDFSLRFLHIAPAKARLARLTPLALERSGIEPVGTADWVDARSRRPLMLVYVDRPARITGNLTRSGETLQYDIAVTRPGYVWIGSRQIGAHETLYSAVPRPQRLILVLTVSKSSP